MKNIKYKGEIFVLLATICWSLSGVLTKGLTISPILSNALRSFIAVFILLAYNKGKIKFNKTIMVGAICGMLTTTMFFISLSLTAAANAIIIQYTAPIFVLMFICIAEKKLPTFLQVFVVLLAFGGVAVIFGGGFSGDGMLGNLAALGAGITFAGVFFVNRLPKASPVDSSIIAFMMSSLTGLFFLNQLGTMTLAEWGSVLMLGLVQHGLAYVFFCIGIVSCASFSSSLIGMLETVLVPLWVFIVFREVPSILSIIGCALIITAVVINMCMDRKIRVEG